jgi:hypothetical protein
VTYIDTNLVVQIPLLNATGEKSAPNYHGDINRLAGVKLCFFDTNCSNSPHWPEKKFMKKHNKSEAPVFDADGYQLNMADLNGEALPEPDKVGFKPFAHGGARQGAGRKNKGRKPLLLRLSPKIIARLRAKAKATHKSVSDVAEETLSVG